ncbi:hypothetical protein C2E23DRAFT_755320 [Lenzites betulinus]|nr:hypothetical protein C2E23DRAFT_755320 [Lenzites betulinus]
MRLKVETVPPLPLLKAWFSTHAVPSILDLKLALCTGLSPLVHHRIDPHHILLLLDDFELLDASPIDVVRDGDLVVIKSRPAPPPTKRKAPAHDAGSPARKRARTHESTVVSNVNKRHTSTKPRAKPLQKSSSESSSDSSSDAESDSDSDSSSSDSDSDSASDASSSSSGSSSSSTSSAPTESPRPGKKRTTTAKNAPVVPQGPPVPPGLGKPTTHSRNLRRRRKKMFERIAPPAEPASVNEIPLGARAHALEAGDAAPPRAATSQDNGKGRETERAEDAAPAFMMASLQNKNKRRGFKNALSHGVPAKIVFPDAAAAADTDAQLVEAALAVAPVPAAQERTAEVPLPQRGFPRLVPPSEKQACGLVPGNMLVTSVDVEEGLWPARGKKNKNKNKKKRRAPAEERYEEAEEADAFAGGLPYDDVPEEPVPAPVLGQASAEGGSTERAVVAAKWDTLRKVADRAQAQVGATVAWKALGINFATFTPEILLHIGRVTQADEKLTVELFADSGAADGSFGSAEDGEDGGPAEETFEWADVFQGDWRLVSAR